MWFIYQTKLTTSCSSKEAESQCDDTDRLSSRSMHSNPSNLDIKLGEKNALQMYKRFSETLIMSTKFRVSFLHLYKK